MSVAVDVVDPPHPKQVLMVASNPAVCQQTGRPIGFCWAELTHPWREFTEHGYRVEIASSDSDPLREDPRSDPCDESGHSAEDLISSSLIHSPPHLTLAEKSIVLAQASPDSYDAVFLVGGQGPI